MKRLFNWIFGVLLLHILHGRYGFLVIIPFVLWIYQDPTWRQSEVEIYQLVLAFYFMWVLFYGMLFGNCRVMNSWTRFWIKILGVKYKEKGQWTTDMMHSFSVWTHPLVEIKGKDYKFSYARMGGNLYDSDANMRRSIIFKWLFS